MFLRGKLHCDWQRLLDDLDKQDRCKPETHYRLAEWSACRWDMESYSLSPTGRHRVDHKQEE